ncbi:NUDIX domain-containing protein [Streptomyces liliifuscus]|uniref:NUDIX domain-containing protein n=1 Tax=Streptomyces liliifuscus TaxID=2797636 RepID=A0A7T7L4P1_9ACTN|nr:NUDIX domain-containing protein [Streptomyces liliifuscus]
MLLSQRGGSYGYRRWHLPSGKLDQGKPFTVGAARELFEETDVRADPDRLELLHVVHHRAKDITDELAADFGCGRLAREGLTVGGVAGGGGRTSRPDGSS